MTEAAISIAIELQHLYIEALLEGPIGPVSDAHDGCARDDEPGLGQPLPVIVCAWCSTAGHAQADCDEWKMEQIEREF